ncbi:MAG: hypothetical protein NT157_00990 [Candidatus Micrarchaeota archaeon]|nr:hypothetical protein [Candidatus Micrarchaeota archaeon]
MENKCSVCECRIRAKNTKRKFGSSVCQKCVRLITKLAARVSDNEMKLEDVPLKYQYYVKIVSKEGL